MIDYVRKMNVKKFSSCKYGKYGLFEQLVLVFCLFLCFCFVFDFCSIGHVVQWCFTETEM